MMKPFEISRGRDLLRAQTNARGHVPRVGIGARRVARAVGTSRSSRRASSLARRPFRVRLRPLQPRAVHARADRGGDPERPAEHLAGVHVPALPRGRRVEGIAGQSAFPSRPRGVRHRRGGGPGAVRDWPGRRVARGDAGHPRGDDRQRLRRLGARGGRVRLRRGLRQGARVARDRRQGAGRRGRGPGAVRGGQTPRRRLLRRDRNGESLRAGRASIRRTRTERETPAARAQHVGAHGGHVNGAGAAGSDDARAAGERPGVPRRREDESKVCGGVVRAEDAAVR